LSIKQNLTKSGFVAVVGRPNAGKSTLLNYLVGEEIAMVSQKANATRKRSKIICMHENAQIIFIDTPGIHEKERLLNQFMMEEALRAMGDAEIILFLAPISDNLKDYEKFLQMNDKKHLVLLTKTDTVTKEETFAKLSEYEKYQERYLALVPVSVKNTSDRDYILKVVSEHLPHHPYYYDTELVTTDNLRDIYKEFIRESIFENMSDEIPYFSDVVIDKVNEKKDIEEIYATIVVEKKSQKGMVIGKGASAIKRIGTYARTKIENLIERKVFLKLHVSVRPGWSKDKKSLEEMGYIL
jgi:GTP-binding protein Era